MTTGTMIRHAAEKIGLVKRKPAQPERDGPRIIYRLHAYEDDRYVGEFDGSSCEAATKAAEKAIGSRIHTITEGAPQWFIFAMWSDRKWGPKRKKRGEPNP